MGRDAARDTAAAQPDRGEDQPADHPGDDPRAALPARIKDFQLWTFLPNTVDYVAPSARSSPSTTASTSGRPSRTRRASDHRRREAAAVQVDVTFCTSQALVDSKRKHTG